MCIGSIVARPAVVVVGVGIGVAKGLAIVVALCCIPAVVLEPVEIVPPGLPPAVETC